MWYGDKSGCNIGLSWALPVCGNGFRLQRRWSGCVPRGLLCACALWATAMRPPCLWTFSLFLLWRDLERVHRCLRRGYRHPRCHHGWHFGASKDAGQQLRAPYVRSSAVPTPNVWPCSLSATNYQVQACSLRTGISLQCGRLPMTNSAPTHRQACARAGSGQNRLG
jgi:hypothetical protein